jgi:hypothetical protein
MESFFTYGNDKIERLEKINLDDLYEKKKTQDQAKLFTYNKILSRLHAKIKLTARQHADQQFCWFVVPEIILGVAHYDHFGCVEYIIEQLHKNGFRIQYTHPNLLLVSWKAYVPTYIRAEFKKKTGVEIDENGDPIYYDESGNVASSATDQSQTQHGGGSGGSGSGIRGGNNAATGGANLNALLYKNGKGGSGPATAGTGTAVVKKDYTPINSYKPTGKLIYNDALFQHIENKL